VSETQTIERLLLSAAETAALLGISRSHFYGLISSGRFGVVGYKLGHSVRYSKAELQRWVEAGCPSRDRWLSYQGT
jgi:excisionase family DNA binding protein